MWLRKVVDIHRMLRVWLILWSKVKRDIGCMLQLIVSPAKLSTSSLNPFTSS